MHIYRVMTLFVVFGRSKNPSSLYYFFDLFPIYLAPSGAKYCGKGAAIVEKALGRVRDGFGKPLILQMQVFGA